MTAKLLPVFLQSFTDSYVSIRIEACISSGNLGVQDASILDKLVHLATYDPIWKVKALAIQGRCSFRTEFIYMTFLPMMSEPIRTYLCVSEPIRIMSESIRA